MQNKMECLKASRDWPPHHKDTSHLPIRGGMFSCFQPEDFWLYNTVVPLYGIQNFLPRISEQPMPAAIVSTAVTLSSRRSAPDDLSLNDASHKHSKIIFNEDFL